MHVSGQLHAPASVLLGIEPEANTEYRAGCAPEPVWKSGKEKLPTYARNLLPTPRLFDKKIPILLSTRNATIVSICVPWHVIACRRKKYASISFQLHPPPDKRKLRVYCSRYSAGDIATKLLPGQPRNFVSIPSTRKEIFSSQNSQTDNGADFVPCLTCTNWGIFPRVQGGWCVNLTAYCNLSRKLQISEVIPHSWLYRNDVHRGEN